LVDYFMVIALFLLLVVLSLPTIVQLTGFFRSDQEMPHPAAAPPESTGHQITDVRSSSRLSTTRSPAVPSDRRVAETQLAH
jgi:hypothetical protein